VSGCKFTLDLREERLLNGDQPVRLTNKAFRLLQYFVQNPNRLLTKDAILDDLWPGVHVSEALIKEYVHDLRAALGDDSKRPEFIETVHGRGYRFHGGIELATDGADATRPSQRRSGPPSVAVLPLENLAGGERWERVCHGICDDLITDLSRFPDLLVIAKSSCFAYKRDHIDVREVGRDLGASYVLEGSMQASDARLRMNLQLVESRNGHHVWAQRYERSLGDLFAVQSDIVAQVASSLGGFEGQIPHAERLRLGRNPPQDLEAYELYLLGYEFEERFDKESALHAFKLLMRSVELDPHFARAWLILAWTCYHIASEKWDHDVGRYDAIAREAYTKAATLDPRDAIALMELSALRVMEGDLNSGVDGLERALDLGYNQADLLAMIGKYVAMILDDPSRAMQIVERSFELNSQGPNWYYMNLVRVAYFAEDFERAVNAAKRGPDTQQTKLYELLAVAQLGRTDELGELNHAFKLRYSDFDLEEFMRDPPIVASGAKSLFLDGIKKAGIQ